MNPQTNRATPDASRNLVNYSNCHYRNEYLDKSRTNPSDRVIIRLQLFDV